MTRLQPDASGFIDLSQVAPGVGVGLAEAYAGRETPSFEEVGAGDFGGTTVADVPADQVKLQSGAVKALQGGLIELQPDQRVSYATGGLAPKQITDFFGSVEGSIMGLGGGLASGASRALNFLSGGLIDLTGSSGPDDPRITELLASDLPEERAAGEMMLRQKREAEAGGRAGFQAETSRIANAPQPGTDPSSWASFFGRMVGGLVPSAIGVLNPIAGAAVLGTFGVNAYESAYDRYVNKSVEQSGTFDPTTANWLGMASGAVEVAIEMLPIKAAKVFGERAVKEAVDAVASGASKLVAAKALAKGVAATAGVEGGEEAVSEVVNSILEVMYDRDLQRQYEEDPQSALTEAAGRVLSAFGQGVIGGALLGGAGVSRAVAMGVEASPRRGETLNQESGPAPVWYSKLRDVVSAKMGGAMDANQLIATLKANGVKDEEIDYSGLRDLTGKVTRERVEETLAENAIEVRDVVLGGGSRVVDASGRPIPDGAGGIVESSPRTRYEQYQVYGSAPRTYRELLLTLPSREKAPETLMNFSEYAANAGYTEEMTSGAWRNGSDPVYAEWERKRFFYDRGIKDYRSSHFAQPNIMAHVRFNERTDAEGRKVLFIEEVQSDWHQEGRDKGYAPSGKVPDAPFKKTWHQLAMKRMIRWAAENGYERIAWTTGDTQANRYDLSQSVKSVGWSRRQDGSKYVSIVVPAVGNDVEREFDFTVDDEGKISGSKRFANGESLADVIGKDVASKVMSDDSGDLSGDGLAIGGHGMRGFYDRMLVNDTNAIIKRWGGKVGLEQIGPVKAHVFDVSREMQNDALARGMTLFQPGTGAPKPGKPTGVMEWNPENVAKALDIPPEQAHAVVALANAMGLDASRLRAQRGGETPGSASAKGQVEFKASGEAIVRGISSPDVSTGIHELSHVARRWLLDRNVPAAERTGITDQDIADAESWAGVGPDGKWSVQHEEKLARAFEKYIRNGQAPTPRLASLFQKFREWMLRIYQKLAGSPLDVKVSPEMRRVFDSLVQRGSVAQAPLPDLYRSALGEGYAETSPETPSRPIRVARPDAIAALVRAELWPEATTPDDLALELLADRKYEPIVHLLVNKRDLSRSDATWLFGANNKEMGDKGNRARWLAAFKDLAPKTSWNVPASLADLAAPPQKPAGGQQATGGSGEVGLRTDRLTRFQRAVQDSLIQVFRLAQDVTPGREFDAGSPVPVMRTLNARISDEQRRLGEERIAPLLDRMAETGITGERVAQYLIARHVPEANQVAARRNPDNPEVASGMSNARAAQVVAMESRAPDFAVLDEIASAWRQILRDEFQASHEAGMMTDVERAAMEQYKNYVPIMDDPEYLEAVDMVDEQGNVRKKRLSIGKTQFIKRTGRTQGMLDNPENPRAKALFEGFLANVMTVTERRISRRQRNDFGNVLRRWLQSNPKVRGAMQVVAEPPLVDAVVDGEVQKVPDSSYRDRDDVLHFKASEDFSVGDKDIRKGETFFIEVADPALGKQMKLATEIGEEGWRFLAGAMHMATRTLTVGATGPLALSFHVDNLIRDIGDITGTIGAQVKAHQIKGYVYRQFRRNMARSFRSLMGGTRDREIQQFRDEWERLGGRMQMLGPIEFAKAKRRIDAALNPTVATNVKDVAAALRNGIRVAVSPFESSTKLAYFASLRQNGVPAEKAAALTRDVMDYEKRGSMTGPLRVAYAFVNPSIQGTERQIAALSANPARLLLAASFTAGLISALQSKLAIANMWGDDDDENEMPDWMQRLDYEKRMRHRIPLGAAGDALGIESDMPDVFSVPVPYSQQLANMLGVMIGEWSTGQRSSVDALKAFGDAAADIYWPIGGSNVYKGFAPLMQSLSPSVVRPIADLAVNRNWYGGTIYNEPYKGQEARWIEAENPMPGTAQFWTDFAQWMERNVGIDMPPETIPYIISSMFSTTGKDATGVFELLADIADGDATTDPSERFPNKIPVLRKYLMEGGNPAYVRQEYDRYAAEAARYMRKLNDLDAKRKATPDQAGRDALLAEIRATQDARLTAVAKEIEDADSRIAKVRRANREARRAYENADAAGDERAKASAQARIDKGREMIAIIMGRATARLSGRTKPASASERTVQTSSREGS